MTTPFDFLNAVSVLAKPDGVIAFPTDTVYGLGCMPSHVAAVEKIYTLKGRSTQKPLILMSYDREPLVRFLGEMTLLQAQRYYDLAALYWPGALTLVVPKNSEVPDVMTQGIETVGLRVPDCPFLTVLFQMIQGGVLATTSANRSEQPESLTSAQVFAAFGSHLEFILQADSVVGGKPSTVAAIQRDGSLSVLRQGSIVLD
jgi:L-threonylcarbamoyladenylate synthase